MLFKDPVKSYPKVPWPILATFSYFTDSSQYGKLSEDWRKWIKEICMPDSEKCVINVKFVNLHSAIYFIRFSRLNALFALLPPCGVICEEVSGRGNDILKRWKLSKLRLIKEIFCKVYFWQSFEVKATLKGTQH